MTSMKVDIKAHAMSRCKTGIANGGHVTQLEFAPADLHTFHRVATDPDFARSMALTLWAVGSVREQKSVVSSYKARIDKALRSKRKTPGLSQQQIALRKRLSKAHRPIDVMTRIVIHAVAFQMRKRGSKVSISVVPGTDRGSPFLTVCQVLLRLMGKQIGVSAIKQQVIKAKVLRFGLSTASYEGDIGVLGVFISENRFEGLPFGGGKYHVRCDEYQSALGWRGFQFHAVLRE